MRKEDFSDSSMDMVFDNLSVGLYYRYVSKDGEMDYVHFNHVMKLLFDSEDVVSSDKWRQEIDDRMDSIVLKTEEPYMEEYRLPEDSGNVPRWLVFYKKQVHAESREEGECYIITTVTDITERKEKELELEQSRLNLKIATDAGKMSTWNLDVDKKIFTITNGLDVKDRTISLEEHVMLRHYGPNSKGMHTDLLQVMTGEKESGEGLYMIKDAETGEILYRKSSFMGIKTGGVVKNVIGSTQDVTESYRQKEALQKNRDELNLALKAGQIAAWIYNIKEKTFHTLYGKAIAGEGISYDKILSLLHPDDRVMLDSHLGSILSKVNNYSYGVYRFKSDDVIGGYRYYDSRMMGRYEEGELISIIGSQRDITDEYLHQMQVEEFELKANIINEATGSVMWDYDIDKHVVMTYSNKAILPGHPMTLAVYSEFVHPKDVPTVTEFFAKADRRETDYFSFEIDLMFPGSNGYKRVSITGGAVKDEGGHIVKYTGIRRDISKQVELTDELKEKDNLKNLVVNNLLAGLILFTDDCRIVWSNDAAKDTFGSIINKKNFLPGQHCDYYENGVCSHQGICIMKQAVEDKKVYSMEYQFGGDKHVEMTAIPANKSDGGSHGVILKLRDVSETKRMIDELKKAKEEAEAVSDFVSALLDRMPSAVFITDPEDEFRYVNVNDKFCENAHTDKKDIIGKNDEELLGKTAAAKYDSYDKLLANGAEGTVSYEATLKLDNKDVYWMINKSVITFGGKRLILSVSTDITSLKELNRELTMAKEKAQQSDKLKSAFLANMSHEIRTPLNAIVGFSQLLSESDDSREKIQFSKIINNNTQMLLRLIGDILDLSKIEAGTTEFKRDLVEVSSYFNELTASLALKVTNPDVKFIVINPYKACYINLDKLRFGQVVTNFVSNAIKYTQKGYIKVSYYIERHGVMIRVDDTGIGIPADKRDRVFTRFDKLDSMVQGTGLGLSIAKAITEAGGGKIWFESEEGNGSSFFSWKPFNDIRVLKNESLPSPDKEIAVKQDSPKYEPVPHVIKKILVAEDNESNYLLMQKMLRNYQIDWAKDGVEAVEKVAKYSYDLVLMDVKMPIMDGIDAVKQIRKFNSAIPIVAITANAYAIDEEEALRAGCNEFLAKPILKDDLMNVISKV